ncbi:hypothetical protein [Massilia niastensis]|uniref:hypothetical protein n=1 Tax=Massilia niastensis TaxID=544911 RepID=UPI0012EB2FE7|nr:hypothetical protein [Massilia niastensis]
MCRLDERARTAVLDAAASMAADGKLVPGGRADAALAFRGADHCDRTGLEETIQVAHAHCSLLRTADMAAYRSMATKYLISIKIGRKKSGMADVADGRPVRTPVP